MSNDPVMQALDEHRVLLDGASTLYLGFSGGLDSTVLLHAAKGRYADKLIALHANHSLQENSGQWVRHCTALCEAWNVRIRVEDLAVEPRGEGLEAAARDARYRWFESCVAQGELLLLAQHQDDQAETLLLRLLRGAGPEGLVAMRPRRRLGTAELLRPLLSLPRSVLECYAAEHSLKWIEDPSNGDSSFDRNYLRQEVLPLIDQRWPGYRKTLGRAARLMGDWVEHAQLAIPASCQSAFNEPGFRLEDLPPEPASAALALRGWLRQRRLRMPPAARLNEFLRQLAGTAGARLSTPEWILERYRGGVYCRSARLALPAAEYRQPAEARADWQGLGRVHVACSGGELPPGLLLRRRQPGDRLALTGKGHSDLKTVFQSNDVPPWWRERLPLLVRETPGGEELLIVGGFASSPGARELGLSMRFDPQPMSTE